MRLQAVGRFAERSSTAGCRRSTGFSRGQGCPALHDAANEEDDRLEYSHVPSLTRAKVSD